MLSDSYYTRLEADLARWQFAPQSSLLSGFFCVFAGPQEERADAIKRRVAAILATYLEGISYARLLRTDAQMRDTTSMEWYAQWTRYEDPDTLLTASMSPAERRAVLIFASFHCNGYLRQRAVRKLPDYPATLPFIALRLWDCVPEVRREAAHAFERHLPQATDREVIETLPLFLGRPQRDTDPASLLTLLEPRLNGNRALFEQILADPLRRVRQFGITTLRTFLPTRCNEMLSHRLACEPDPYLRRRIFQTLLDSGQDLGFLYDRLLRDKYPPNRLLALQSLHRDDPAAGETMARSLLLDKNARVRYAAQQLVLRHEPAFDLPAFYRGRVGESPLLVLAEVDGSWSSEDTLWIEPFLDHPRPAICRAAMAALMRIDPWRYVSRIRAMLDSPQHGIAKTAARLLRRLPLL